MALSTSSNPSSRYDDGAAASVEEVAACLSALEGRQVTVSEVMLVEKQALLKLRRELVRRGLTPGNMLPEG